MCDIYMRKREIDNPFSPPKCPTKQWRILVHIYEYDIGKHFVSENNRTRKKKPLEAVEKEFSPMGLSFLIYIILPGTLEPHNPLATSSPECADKSMQLCSSVLRFRLAGLS